MHKHANWVFDNIQALGAWFSAWFSAGLENSLSPVISWDSIIISLHKAVDLMVEGLFE